MSPAATPGFDAGFGDDGDGFGDFDAFDSTPAPVFPAPATAAAVVAVTTISV